MSSDNNNEDQRSSSNQYPPTPISPSSVSSRKSDTSISSEYLRRIQEETNRIRQKRKQSQQNQKTVGALGAGVRAGSVGAGLVEVAGFSTESGVGDKKNNTTATDTNTDTVGFVSEKVPTTIAIGGTATERAAAKTIAVGSATKLSWNEIVTSSQRHHLTLISPLSSNSRKSKTVANDEDEDEFSYIYTSRPTINNISLKSPSTNNEREEVEQLESANVFSWNIIKRIKKNSSNNKIKMSSSIAAIQKYEHEQFRTKLIDEVLGNNVEDGKVPMEKVMMIIWFFRDDKEVMKFMTRFVSKYAGQRDVFDGIEFYLPQLAHMIIHLESGWDDAILERFSLVIAQQSIHFALQLNWILAGAIEDYQPELPDGTLNPTHNPLYYSRCVKLLTNIERVVVYRRPRSQELQRLYEKGSISKSEMECLERADRRFTAMQITAASNKVDDEKEDFGGTLKYKRALRSSCFKFKRWKTRYFVIEERMLNCYNTEGGTLRRSMPMEGATIEPMKQSGKYPNMFSVTNRSFEFRMRASSKEDMNKWITMLEADSNSGRVFGHTDGSLFSDENKDAQRVIDELTPTQRERYQFYRHERDFVRRITDIAEDLRFHEPPERKKLAPVMMKDLEVPESVYSPLLSSTDIFRRIHSTIYQDTKVFNTKARCPTVMYFLGVRGEMEYKGEHDANMDIAEYIHLKFNKADTQHGSSDNLFKDAEFSTTIEENGEELINVQMDTDPHISELTVTLRVKKTSSSSAEADELKSSLKQPPQEKDDDVEISSKDPRTLLTPEKSKSSIVWSGSLTDDPNETPAKNTASKSPGSPARGNRHLKKFLRESMVSVPRKLAHTLERQKSKRNNGITSTTSSSDFQIVPIVAGRHSSSVPENKTNKDVYIGKSSVMDHDVIIKGKSHIGDIDQESLERAKEIVSGGETWAEKSFRMLEQAKNKPEGDVQLEIVVFISKSNDDLRQEVFVMQMIHYYKSVFIAAGLPLWLKTYKILSTSASTGLLEMIVDATSLDGLKKSDGYPAEGGLRKYFETTYGGPTSRSFKAAQRNFMESLAAYSIVCYLLGLKDRHNGNIMIDMFGHLIHIDYGFCMGMCVGHEFTMERAPFKLTEEYVEVMGGPNSDCYKEFVHLFVEGLKAARQNSQIALGLVEIMMYRSNYPCFSGSRYGGGQALRGFRERLMLDVPDSMVENNAKALIKKARNHLGTRAYDSFQQWSNGYAI